MPWLHADLQGGDLRSAADDVVERTGRHRHLRYLRHGRARQGSRLHHLFESVRRRSGRQGQSEEARRYQSSLCGAAAAENTGFVEVPLVQALVPKCKAAGKPEPTLQLYDNNANCIQAILAGRADTYVNDVNTVDQAVKANPDKLEKALAVTIPYSVGIARSQGQARIPRRGAGRADRSPEGRNPHGSAEEVGSRRQQL